MTPFGSLFPLPSIVIGALQRVFIAPPHQGHSHDVNCARNTNVMKIHGVSSSPHRVPDGFYRRANCRNREFCKSSPKSNGSNSDAIRRGFSSSARVLSWPEAVEPQVKPNRRSQLPGSPQAVLVTFGVQGRGARGRLSGVSGATGSAGGRRNRSPARCFGRWDVGDR